MAETSSSYKRNNAIGGLAEGYVKGITNGRGCNTTIRYNPNLEKEEGWKRPPVVGLAHEIQHAFEMDAGKYNATKVFC